MLFKFAFVGCYEMKMKKYLFSKSRLFHSHKFNSKKALFITYLSITPVNEIV